MNDAPRRRSRDAHPHSEEAEFVVTVMTLYTRQIDHVSCGARGSHDMMDGRTAMIFWSDQGRMEIVGKFDDLTALYEQIGDALYTRTSQ